MAILEVHHIEKHFGATRVLEDISFALEQGQALAIIGSSGSGKTTLLRCLNFLETPDQGQIVVQGDTLFDAADPATQRESEVRKKRLHFGLVFQSFNLFPQYTALKNVTLAKELLAKEQPDFKTHKKEILEQIEQDGLALLERMGLTRENLMVCGDGLNDRSMISYAGVGVAMQNAEDAVKAVADYVTAADNNRDGVAEAIEKFILN